MLLMPLLLGFEVEALIEAIGQCTKFLRKRLSAEKSMDRGHGRQEICTFVGRNKNY
jgi:hypothetical protein